MEAAVALIRKIEVEFAGVPRPMVTLRVARAFDDEWIVSKERGLELREQDPETDWREVSSESIRSYQEYFTFSGDDAGWLFYLPAFMCDHLRALPGIYGWYAAYHACTELKPGLRLTDGQLACIIEFMTLSEHHDPRVW